CFLHIDRTQSKEVVASYVSERDQSVMSASKTPTAAQIFGQSFEAPAWKDFPTWYLVASEDHAINPDLERLFAQRMKATTREVKSSHVPFASNPSVVAEIIIEAAQVTAERAATV